MKSGLRIDLLFNIVTKKEDEFARFRITEGYYKGTEFSYNTVGFDESSDPPVLKFKYIILEDPMDIESDINIDDSFHKLLFDILVFVIELGTVNFE